MKLFFLFSCVFAQCIFGSLQEQSLEIKKKILDYITQDDSSCYDILPVRLVSKDFSNAANLLLRDSFKNRYENFPWLRNEDRRFDPDFLPSFLSNITLDYQKTHQCNPEENPMCTFHVSSWKKKYSLGQLFNTEYNLYTSLKEEAKVFLDLYPFKRELLHQVYLGYAENTTYFHNNNLYKLSATAMKDVFRFIAEKGRFNVFNIILRLTNITLEYNNQNWSKEHLRKLILVRKNIFEWNVDMDREFASLYIKKFLLIRSGIEKSNAYSIDLKKIDAEKSVALYKKMITLIDDEKIRVLCGNLYNEIVTSQSQEVDNSKIMLLDLFVHFAGAQEENNNRTLQDILAEVIASLSSFPDDCKDLFFKFCDIIPLPVYVNFYLLQKIADFSQQDSDFNDVFFNRITTWRKKIQWDPIEFEGYYKSIFDLCKNQDNQERLQHAFSEFALAQKQDNQTLLLWIEKYIAGIHDVTANQTFLFTPLVFHVIENMVNQDNLHQVLQYCEKTIERHGELKSSTLSFLISLVIKNKVNSCEGSKITCFLDFCRQFPHCFHVLHNVDVIDYCMANVRDDTSKYRSLFIQCVGQKNYFAKRFFGKVGTLSSVGIDAEHAFYKDLMQFFNFIDGDVELFYEWLQCLYEAGGLKEEYYWNYFHFAWFANNPEKLENLLLLLDRLYKNNNALYQDFLRFMLPTTHTFSLSHTFCREWPADFFINTCSKHLIQALQILRHVDEVKKYRPVLYCMNQEPLNSLFDFLYKNDRQFYIDLYGMCCKLALTKNYHIKHLSKVHAPNPIFLYYFNLYGKKYIEDLSTRWNPCPTSDEELDNNWELQLLSDQYSGMISLDHDFLYNIFIETSKKGLVFFQFLLRFARQDNLKKMLFRDDFMYIYNETHKLNEKFFVSSDRLLRKRLNEMGLERTFFTPIDTHNWINKHPTLAVVIIYGSYLVAGGLCGALLAKYQKTIHNFFKTSSTILSRSIFPQRTDRAE